MLAANPSAILKLVLICKIVDASGFTFATEPLTELEPSCQFLNQARAKLNIWINGGSGIFASRYSQQFLCSC